MNNQITCLCNRYDFPHRLGGGKCNGRDWAEAYFINHNTLCIDCNCNNVECEVATGAEELEKCEAYMHFIHSHEAISLPKDMDDELDKMIEENYER